MRTFHSRFFHLLFACLFACLVANTAYAQQVGFHIYDPDGNELRWEKFRLVQENWRTLQGSGDTERKPLCDLCKRVCSRRKCEESVCDKSAGDVDILLDPTLLTVIYDGGQARTLSSSEGRDGNGKNGFPVFDWPDPGKPFVTIALAWPTESGYYSTVLLDIPRPGVREGFYERGQERGTSYFVFNFIAAQQALERLEHMLRERSAPSVGRTPAGDEFGLEYRPSAGFTRQYEQAKAFFTSARNATTERDKGRWGAKSFDAAVSATLLLLKEYGIQYGQSGRAVSRAGSPPQHWGVTFEFSGSRATIADDLRSVSQLVDGSRDEAWVRIIFQKDTQPETYMPLIKEAHRQGLRVLGQLRDSYEIKGTKRRDWQEYVKRYVDALSDTKTNPQCTAGEPTPSALDCDVDQWEVGNEVNGEWIVEDDPDGILSSGEYIYYAADYIKNVKRLKKRTLLTLYWQLGNLKSPKFSMFEWLDKSFKVSGKPLSGKQHLFDDIGISLYPDKTPMGPTFDRVMTTLRSYFPLPGQRIMITELGYWPEHQTDPICQYGHIWRMGAVPGAGDGDPGRDVMRGEVAQFYQAAVFGYPYSGGGTYWWYYLQEKGSETKRGAVWNALHSLYQTIKHP